jgi:LemA protein
MYILWGGIAVIFVWVIGSYNGLVTLKTRVKEALSDIDVQLKRRFDLIPNLVETVKGYMSHEANVLEKVTEARASVAQSKGNPLERDKAESALSGTLKTLFAVSENYPELKANTNFVELQRELSDTENKIQAARRFYNSNVREINIRVQRFPTNLIAGIFGFKVEPFFETEAGEKEPVKVQF